MKNTPCSSTKSTIGNVFIAQVRLFAALGALSHQRLLPGTERYDPLNHFDRVADDATCHC